MHSEKPPARGCVSRSGCRPIRVEGRTDQPKHSVGRVYSCLIGSIPNKPPGLFLMEPSKIWRHLASMPVHMSICMPVSLSPYLPSGSAVEVSSSFGSGEAYLTSRLSSRLIGSI
ncbi:unnamed protein product [Protopolystoma xenopodis]|uniref:Uncharacterized protein n=1 Tax=Protopolystoma xenopodis TaxID=117903 RepID=A0A3S5FD06_9PLAT|nr:unnamed protein product [Protopolystoma xenopodis]